MQRLIDFFLCLCHRDDKKTEDVSFFFLRIHAGLLHSSMSMTHKIFVLPSKHFISSIHNISVFSSVHFSPFYIKISPDFLKIFLSF